MKWEEAESVWSTPGPGMPIAKTVETIKESKLKKNVMQLRLVGHSEVKSRMTPKIKVGKFGTCRVSYDYQILTESSESPLAFLTSFYLSHYSISLHLFIFLVIQ